MMNYSQHSMTTCTQRKRDQQSTLFLLYMYIYTHIYMYIIHIYIHTGWSTHFLNLFVYLLLFALTVVIYLCLIQVHPPKLSR